MQFGTTGYTHYPFNNQAIYDDFGSNAQYQVGDPPQPLDQYHLYETSAKAGEWMARLNCFLQFRSLTNTVAFTNPVRIGRQASGYHFAGDIAEIMVYERVLTAEERQSVRRYLLAKYALEIPPETPTALAAVAVSASQVSLGWNQVSGNVAVQFNVERRVAGGSFAEIARVDNATSYIDGTAVAGLSYEYRVRAIGTTANSGYSNTTTAVVPSTGAAMPLNGLRLWLKADAVAQSPVSRWADQSGLQNQVLQGTVTNRPLVVQNALNGRPVVRFDGSNDFLEAQNVMTGATAGEAFYVLKAAEDGAGAVRGFMQFGTTGYTHYPFNNNSIYDDFGSNAQYQVGDPRQRLDEFHLYGTTAKSGEWKARLNDFLQFRSLTNTVAFTNPVRIARQASGYHFKGDIAEILIYDRVLSFTERESVSRYLNIKYLIPNMDADKDGLTNSQEASLGTSPLIWDTNRDGLSDRQNILMGFDPLSDDVDGDGLTNAEEYAVGANPFWWDSDNDGVADGQDTLPLDAAWSSPAPQDQSGPIITLLTPPLGTL
jgi:hypothetical protein